MMRSHPVLLLTAVALAVTACEPRGPRLPDPIERDWAQIQTRDTLVVLMENNSTTYFLYRGEPMGFEYALLQQFAADHDIHLRTEVVQDAEELLNRLTLGQGDVVAARLVPRMIDMEGVAFTDALYRTPPALVQREAPSQEIGLPEAVDTVVGAAAAGGPDGPRLVRVGVPRPPGRDPGQHHRRHPHRRGRRRDP
jgi:hypothetical protein